MEKRQLLPPDDFNTTRDLCEVQDLSWTREPDLTGLKCISSLVMAATADEFVKISFRKVNRLQEQVGPVLYFSQGAILLFLLELNNLGLCILI